MATVAPLTLKAATSDVHFTQHGGLFKADYFDLTKKLLGMEQTQVLPQNYITGVLRPFNTFLASLNKETFELLFTSDPKDLSPLHRFYRKIIPDISEALLQRDHEGVYYSSAHDDLLAFQAVVTSIYQTILEKKIQTVSRAILPPLAKWGKDRGPYTWTVHATHSRNLKLQAGIVSLPPENRDGGLLAWSSLGHEVAGHNFLCSNDELLPDLEGHVRTALQGKYSPNLVTYWERCVEETTSDILGVLNIGPVSAAALIGYFRGVRGGKLKAEGIYPGNGGTTKKTIKLYSSDPERKVVDLTIRELPGYVSLPQKGGHLGKVGESDIIFESYFSASEKHPVDLLRPFVLLEVIDALTNLGSEERERWKALINEEVYNDYVDSITVTETDPDAPTSLPHQLSTDQAIEAGKIVAKTILHAPLKSLNGQSLIQVFNWTDGDEAIVAEYKEAMKQGKPSPQQPKGSFRARYVVAAATQASLEENADIQTLFERMKEYLLDAYNKSKTWSKGDHIKLKWTIKENPEEVPEPRYYFGAGDS